MEHQHRPNCKHGHHVQGSNGGHEIHGSHGHTHRNHQAQIDPKQYFQKLAQIKKDRIEFYWSQILSGNALNKYFEQNGLDFFKSINFQIILMVVARAQMMFTFQWMPLILRPFISGLFFPLIFLIFFNFNVIFGVDDIEYSIVHVFAYLTVLFYVLAAIKQGGSLTTNDSNKNTDQACKQRPYIQNMKCGQCKILKIFRSFHCPVCKICVPKFTRHSLAFSTCVGASNQLLVLGYFSSLTVTQLFVILTFFTNTEYGIITNIMFYTLNLYIFWIGFVESMTFFINNFYFGLTEYEIRTWMQCQYLIKIPERQFTNSINKGLYNNLKQSLYALFLISGYESEKKIKLNPMQEQVPIAGKNNEFQALDKNKTYLINWSKAFFYLTPQIPSYCSRDTVIQIMARQEPRMIEMFKLQKKFKEEVLKQAQGQQLNDYQIQQKVMMKTQQHMMKNGPQMMGQNIQSQHMRPMSNPNMQQPPPQQQKIMQIQMLTHMSNQLQNEQPEFALKIKQIMTNLKQDKMTPMEIGFAMRQIQGDLMRKKMQSVMIEKTAKQEKIKQQSRSMGNQDEEEHLKKQEQLADQDL